MRLSSAAVLSCLSLALVPALAAGESISVAVPCKWGPHCSTPGTHLTLKEIQRAKYQGLFFANYRLSAAGLPSDKLYVLWHKAAGEEPERLLTGLGVDKDGTLTCPADSGEHAADRMPGGPAAVILTGGIRARPRASDPNAKPPWCTVGYPPALAAWAFMPGEPFSVALISTDDSARAYGTVSPWPIEAQSGPCHLSLELVTPTSVSIAGEGFQEGETVTFASTSGPNPKGGARADDLGSWVTIITPADQGHTGGKARFTATGAKCAPTLEYFWGDQLRAK